MKIAGIILIVLGALACIYQFIPVPEEKQDLKIGSLTVQHQETHFVPVTVAGVVLIVVGAGVLAMGAARK
jgi:hypothetical protein